MNDSDAYTPPAQSERDFRAVLEGSHVAWIVMDSGGFITDWNSQAEATFGWSREEVVGEVLADVIVPERYREAHWQGVQRYLATGEGRFLGSRIEIEALHQEGFEFPIELTISARPSAVAVEFNAFLHDISDRRRAAVYVGVQHAVTRMLVSVDSPSEVITGVLRELGEGMDWSFGAYWRPNQGGDDLVCAETWTSEAVLAPFAAESRALVLKGGLGLPGRVWRSGLPAFLTEAGRERNFPNAGVAAASGLHAAICFPLGAARTRHGVAEFFTRAIRQTDDRLLAVLASVGVQVGQHLSVLQERAELLAGMKALALTDDLTGLPNRRAWQEELGRELTRAQRRGERFSVAIIDLDHFKAFNDTRGHQAGDHLLKVAATEWSAAIRGSDLIARYGGEEFGVLLPGCPPAPASEVVERVRVATPLGQTCSAGIASWDGTESIEELVARADAALYQAKRNGRDRIELAGPQVAAE